MDLSFRTNDTTMPVIPPAPILGEDEVPSLGQVFYPVTTPPVLSSQSIHERSRNIVENKQSNCNGCGLNQFSMNWGLNEMWTCFQCGKLICQADVLVYLCLAQAIESRVELSSAKSLCIVPDVEAGLVKLAPEIGSGCSDGCRTLVSAISTESKFPWFDTKFDTR